MKKRNAEENRYFWISFALTLLTNRIAFWGGRLLTQGRVHHSLALPADFAFPFLPWTISVYMGCFVFWFLLYRLSAGLPREQADRFFCANHLGKAVCLLLFVLIPTTITRPVVSGSSFWENGIRMVYSLDTPDCLFPSVHCFISWLCWVGVRGNKKVPFLWRAAALLMAVLVCLSTLTVRQHVLLDVFAGIALSEISYWIAGIPAVRSLYSRLVGRIAGFLAGQ